MNAENAQRPPKRLAELDCLRGIAAISVVFFHFSLRALHSKLNYVLRFGCTGVDLFFMISGFVIFLSLAHTTSYKAFLWARFARLYPAYWTCVSITSVLIIYVTYRANQPVLFPDLKDYAINLTMLQYYFHVENIDGPYWTLIIELLFYLFMLFVFLLKKLNRIEVLGFAAVSLSLLNELVFKHNLLSLNYFLNTYIPLINHIPLFIAGIVFYKIKFDRVTLQRFILLILCFITQICLYQYAGLSSTVMTQFEYAIIIALFFMVFTLYYFNKLHFIVNRVTLFLGKISYSLYLVHQYVSLKVLVPLFTLRQNLNINYWLAVFLIILPIVLITAILIK